MKIKSVLKLTYYFTVLDIVNVLAGLRAKC